MVDDGGMFLLRDRVSDVELEECLPLDHPRDRGYTGHVINVVEENQNVTVNSHLAPSAGGLIVPAHTKTEAEDEAWPLDMSEAWRRFLDW